MQLAKELPQNEYASYGYSILVSGAYFGLLVGVALNMAIVNALNAPSHLQASYVLLKKTLPLIIAYLIVSVANQTIFPVENLSPVTVIMGATFVLLNSLNSSLLSLLAARNALAIAGTGYFVSALLLVASIYFLKFDLTFDARSCIALVLLVSLVTLIINGLLIFSSKQNSLAVDWNPKNEFDWAFLYSALKLNSASTFFQLAVLLTLNVLATRGSVSDIAYFSFASQVFNQFGFIGIILYPFFLQMVRKAGDTRTVAKNWIIYLSAFGSALYISVKLYLFFITDDCSNNQGCFGVSAATPISINLGILIGLLIVIRSPIAWTIQIERRSKLEIMTHILSSLLIVAPVIFWPSYEIALYARVLAHLVLIIIPLLIFSSSNQLKN